VELEERHQEQILLLLVVVDLQVLLGQEKMEEQPQAVVVVVVVVQMEEPHQQGLPEEHLLEELGGMELEALVAELEEHQEAPLDQLALLVEEEVEVMEEFL
jgi:hypothetical protein